MGKDEVDSINRVNYRHHDTFTCTVGNHLPHPHHRIGIITPDKLLVPIYRPRWEWIAWLARARLYVHDLLRVITRSNPKTRAGI